MIAPRPLSYSLAVYTAPGDPPSGGSCADAPLAFAEAAVAAGHRVQRMFFFHDGVHFAGIAPSHPLARRLNALAVNHGVELFTCTAACERRGVRPQAPFEEVGVGQLVDAATRCERHVTFLG